MAFGLILFIDVFYRLFFVYEFYSDNGVLPRDVWIGQFLSMWESSLFLFNGQVPMVTALMLVLLFFAATFTLGLYTRFSALICWILLTSLHARNQIILHGGDDVFRCILFWFQFLPLGAEFSVDKYLNQYKAPKKSILTFGSAGLLLQLLSVYIFTALLKWHPIWHTEGSASYYALSLDQFTSAFGQWMLNFQGLMKFFTFSTMGLETLGPIILLLPFAMPWVRIAVVLSFISFHFGLFLTMVLGPFPWVCIACWLMALPPELWDRWPNLEIKPLQKIADFLRRYDIKGAIPKLEYHQVLQGIAATFIVLVFCWNVSQLDFLKLERTKGFRIVMSVAQIYQRWSMFAPYPRKDDGWYVVDAKLFDGSRVDPMQGGTTPDFEKPDNVAGTYKNSMWRKYLTNIWLRSYNKYRLHFGRYLCRIWNSRQEDPDRRIDTLEISYMLEMTPAPGQPVPLAKKEVIWRHYCFDKPADWKD